MFVGFIALVIVALLADSKLLLNAGVNGQPFANLIVPLFLILIIAGLEPNQRLTALLVVPVTALGELILSILLRLYIYKFEAVPFYVPFGHAVLFSTALLVSNSALVLRNEDALRRILLAMYAALFGIALLANDSLSIVFALPFALVLYRSRGKLFYLIMGVLVLYIEWTGVILGCWRWSATPLGVLHALNPPLGVFVIYVVGDTLILRLSQFTGFLLKHFGTRSKISFAPALLLWLGLNS